MLQASEAQALARNWIRAWNSHDLDSIMAHYAEDIRIHSPVIAKLGVAADGKVEGKAAVRAYFARGLEAYPDLHFELKSLLLGSESIVLVYDSIEGKLSAELMVFDETGQIVEVRAHYSDQ